MTTAGMLPPRWTSVHSQLRATLCGAGIGLLPAFVAEQEPSLRRVLHREVAVVPQFTACLASRRLRRPAAARVFESIKASITDARTSYFHRIDRSG
ncbi:hypothetical protein [Saccharothrix deserti]|uniref:hypothetical protein n=1 Tax=Saccharothrix deserti TaxID=2593674 RepID=UPI00131E56BB|nr:hypothetical protein [Saccharothrix deserti]